MNKQQTDEYLRLGMKVSELYDKIRKNKNDMWKLGNQRIALGQENGRTNKEVTELTKQQHRLLGRSWIDLEEEKEENKKESR